MSVPHLAVTPAAPTPATAPDETALAAIQRLVASHGHTLTVEQRAAVRGWLGRFA